MSLSCPGGVEIGLLGLCGDGAAHVVRVDDGDLDGMVAVRARVLAWLDVGAYLEGWGGSAEVRPDDLHEVAAADLRAVAPALEVRTHIEPREDPRAYGDHPVEIPIVNPDDVSSAVSAEAE